MSKDRDIDAVKCLKKMQTNISIHRRIGDAEMCLKDTFYCGAKYYGLTPSEADEIEEIVLGAERNPITDTFPDFIHNKCFIEHYNVGSTEEAQNGSELRKIDGDNEKEARGLYRRNIDYAAGGEGAKAESKRFEFSHPEHSHENLIKTITRNAEKHIRKHKKDIQKYSTKVFLIQYEDAALYEINNGTEEQYMFGRDRDVLSILLNYKNDLDYVVFSNLGFMEVVKIDKIPDMMKGITEDVIYGARSLSTVISVEVHSAFSLGTGEKQ